MSQFDFKNENSFSKRLCESQRIMHKYPDRVPIICQRYKKASASCPLIDKKKYLIPNDLTVAQFIYVIRRRLTLPKDVALYMFVNGKIPTNSELISTLYETEKENDGFIYFYYSQENTFGFCNEI